MYLADDLRHERKVAAKVLKPELAAVVGAERFLAEIKVTANLQHPNILPLHDSGEADGFLFLVTPYPRQLPASWGPWLILPYSQAIGAHPCSHRLTRDAHWRFDAQRGQCA